MTVYEAALIITHNRHELLEQCVTRVEPQVNSVFIIDNMSDPPVRSDWDANVRVWHEPLQPPNIGYMWNLGLDYIQGHVRALGIQRWNVSMLCDDTDVPEDWVSRVGETMRYHNATAASAHYVRPITTPIIHRQPDGDIMNRMHGAAFVLNGERGIRADESMHWWFQDTDIDWQCRLNGGVVIVPGPIAVNLQPNFYTNTKPELGARTGEDREAFRLKWGGVPW